MRVRVPVAVRNRMLRLEARRPVNLPMGGWPDLMELDAWEVLASRLQDALVAFAHEDIAPPPVTMPIADVPKVRKADDGLGEQRPRSGVEEYLEAQRKIREGRLKYSTSASN